MTRGAAAVLAALAAAATASAAAPARSSLKITVRSAAGKVVRHPHPPAGDAGDAFSSTLLLLDRRTRAKVGSMSYSYTLLKVCHGFTSSCNATARVATKTTFRNGTILASGARVSIARPAIVVRVTGGTGRYRGARGTLTFGPASTQLNVYDLSLPS